jgi:hypothetical protein
MVPSTMTMAVLTKSVFIGKELSTKMDQIWK